MWKWLIFFLFPFFLFGCGEKTARVEQVNTFKEVSLFAKEHGMAGTANMRIDGNPSGDFRTGMQFHTGVSAEINLQWNSLAEPRGKAETSVGDSVKFMERIEDNTVE